MNPTNFDTMLLLVGTYMMFQVYIYVPGEYCPGSRLWLMSGGHLHCD